jgi:hypothetical protein
MKFRGNLEFDCADRDGIDGMVSLHMPGISGAHISVTVAQEQTLRPNGKSH